MTQGHLMEIFSSYQGEGIWVGVPQIFVRLGRCHLRCSYCDTPDSWSASRTYRVEVEPGTRRFETLVNPAQVSEVVGHVRRLLGKPHHSISVTGGEPLLQSEFLVELLPALRPILPIYLETSGTLSDRMERLAPHVDYFALDFKPPSTPGVKIDLEDFRRCVRVASRAPAQVKIVVMRDSPTEAEVESACEIVRLEAPEAQVVFTPVTEVNEECRAPGGDRLKALREAAERRGRVPLIIPQIHPLVGWL